MYWAASCTRTEQLNVEREVILISGVPPAPETKIGCDGYLVANFTGLVLGCPRSIFRACSNVPYHITDKESKRLDDEVR